MRLYASGPKTWILPTHILALILYTNIVQQDVFGDFPEFCGRGDDRVAREREVRREVREDLPGGIPQREQARARAGPGATIMLYPACRHIS